MLLFSLLSLTFSRPLTYEFETKLDHQADKSTTFTMRYIVDEYYWNLQANNETALRPILFYTGNEGNIWDFYRNTGFVTKTLAERWGALVVFAEHRYFGNSLPFPEEIAFTEPYHYYLTVEQAMGDFADLI